MLYTHSKKNNISQRLPESFILRKVYWPLSGSVYEKKHTSSMRERKIDENKCLTEVTFVVNNSRSGKVFALSHLLIFSRMKMYVCVCAKKISARVYATHNIIIIIIQRKYKLIHTCSLQRYTLIYFFSLCNPIRR